MEDLLAEDCCCAISSTVFSTVSAISTSTVFTDSTISTVSSTGSKEDCLEDYLAEDWSDDCLEDWLAEDCCMTISLVVSFAGFSFSKTSLRTEGGL